MRWLARLLAAIAAGLTAWVAMWEKDEAKRHRRLATGRSVAPHVPRRDWRPAIYFAIACGASLAAWNSPTARRLVENARPVPVRGIEIEPEANIVMRVRDKPPPVEASTSNTALSLPGTQSLTAGRARILIASGGSDPSRHQMNVGNTDFSYDWWMRFDAAGVGQTQSGSSACDTGSYGFTSADIFLDNDRLEGNGAPSSDGGYGAGVFLDSDNANRGRVIFSIRDTGGDFYSVCSDAAIDMGDDAWHHYLFQWENSTGQMALYVNGVREGYTATSSVTGDISQSLTFSYTGQNGYLVIGNEKHNIVTQPFTGLIDELRISDALRQASWPTSYTVATHASGTDFDAVGHYRFDNDTEADSATNEVAVPADPSTWTNKLEVMTGVTFAASTDSTERVLVFSNFDTQGTGLPYVLDNGKWDSPGSWINTHARVVASDGAPTPNMYEFWDSDGGGDDVWLNQSLDAPNTQALGEWWTWRFYHQVTGQLPNVTEPGGWTDHGIALRRTGFNSGRQWFTEDNRENITDSLRVGWQDLWPTDGRHWFAGSENRNIATGQWHRYEIAMRMLTTTTFEVRAWIYDTDDSTILYGPTDFVQGGAPSNNLADATFSGGDFREDFRRFVGFMGGVDGTVLVAGVYEQWAGVAAVTGLGVGAYESARGW